MQQFEWAWENKKFEEDLWYGSSGELSPYNEIIRNNTKSIFEQTDIFFITLGLAEIWYDIKNQDAFWRAVPVDKFDPNRHGFKISTVEENLKNLDEIHSLIRKYRPDAYIVFTLSPVPLAATFRPVSCITANSVSKSILRVALDEFFRSHPQDKRLLYFPSYEMVTTLFDRPFMDDLRHPHPDVIKFIMQTFERYYCLG